MKTRAVFLSFAMLTSLLFSSVLAQAQDFESQVQEMYVAYYGRPGDAGGVTFWAGELQDKGGNLDAIIDSFGNSQEFVEQFGALPEDQLINNIYLQLFGRDADPGGLAFYLERLQSGALTLASIALDISNGVQDGTDDASIVANKLEIAAVFTAAVEIAAVTYGGDQIDAARQLLDNVDGSDASRDAALDSVLALVSDFPGSGGPDPFQNFVDNVSDDVLQAICINCHFAGGLARGTRLVYVNASNPDYHNLNYQKWVALAIAVDDIETYALRKVQGMLGHGGGVQARVGSDAYIALEEFLQLLSSSGN